MSASEISIDVDVMAQLPAKSMLEFIAKKQKVDQFFQETAVMLRDAAPLFRFLEQKNIDLRFDADYFYTAMTFAGSGDLFAEVWAEMRRNGFTPTHRPKKGDIDFAAYWDRPGCSRLFMTFTSSVCKRVQVGVRMVEQAVYETRCGEALPEISADDVVAQAPALPAPSSESQAGDIPF